MIPTHLEREPEHRECYEWGMSGELSIGRQHVREYCRQCQPREQQHYVQVNT